MTCDQNCVDFLTYWLAQNGDLLLDAQESNDPNRVQKAHKRRLEISTMIQSRKVSSLASVPFHQLNDDIEFLIQNAI